MWLVKILVAQKIDSQGGVTKLIRITRVESPRVEYSKCG